MGTLGHVIRDRRQRLGLSMGRVAAMSGCAKSYLSAIENDRRAAPPSESVLSRLEASLQMPPGDLLRLGRWQSAHPQIREEVVGMRRREALGRRLASLLKAEGVDALHRSGELSRLVTTLAPEGGVDIAPAPLALQVPVINRVAAGYPAEFTDLGYPARVADEYISVPDIADPDAFAARVCGDSMLPEYSEGDIVVFSPERDTPDGSDCFVRLERDDATTFKRIYFEPGGEGRERIRLQPLNSAYAARWVEREDVAGLYAAVYVVRAVGAR